MKRSFSFIITVNLILLLTAFSGCQKSKKLGNEIARVGDNALYNGEIEAALTEMGLDPANQQFRSKYINQWVDHNLLLHEAHRRGLDRDESVTEQLKTIKEQLIINRLFENAVNRTESDEAAVIKYWRDHTGEFTRPTDEVKIILVTAGNKNIAWGVRNSMDMARTATEIVGTYASVKLDTLGWIPEEQLPRSIRRNLRNLRAGDPSLPFQMGSEWKVVKLVERAKSGSTREVDEVDHIIRARLTAEKIEHGEIEFITKLRQEARREGIVQLSIPDDLYVTSYQETSSTDSDSLEIEPDAESPGDR